MSQFKDVLEFTSWFIGVNAPLILSDGTAFKTDDACSFIAYRDKRFQVEVYIINKNQSFGNHSHPGIDLISISLKELKLKSVDELIKKCALKSGDYHGGDSAADEGGACTVLVVCQHWIDESVPMTSASIRWKGVTAGKFHVQEILKQYPDAFVDGLYVDVTKSAQSAG